MPETSWIGQILGGILVLLVLVCFVLALYGFVYWLNQHAVRTALEPRRQELLAMLASLKDDFSGEVTTAAETRR